MLSLCVLYSVHIHCTSSYETTDTPMPTEWGRENSSVKQRGAKVCVRKVFHYSRFISASDMLSSLISFNIALLPTTNMKKYYSHERRNIKKKEKNCHGNSFSTLIQKYFITIWWLARRMYNWTDKMLSTEFLLRF